MKDGRTLITQAYCVVMADAYLYCIQKGIHFPSDDYSRTPAVLFIWLKAQMICIDSLFILCWTRHCISECRQNGPNYSKRCLPVTPQQSKMMKASNWEQKSNQRPLVVFCKFKNGSVRTTDQNKWPHVSQLSGDFLKKIIIILELINCSPSFLSHYD